MASVRIIGVGNDYRSDDAVGLQVVRKLALMDLPGVETAESSGEGGNLLSSLQNASEVILVDASRSGAEPGTIRWFDAHVEPLPTSFFSYSTHAFSVAEAVEMARVLGALPDRLSVCAIEGATFSYGLGLSDLVSAQVPKVIHDVRDRCAIQVSQNLSNHASG